MGLVLHPINSVTLALRLRDIETFRLKKIAGVAHLHRDFLIEKRFKIDAR